MKCMEIDAAYDLHQSYTASGVEYSNACDERDDHGYASLHDMVDMDVHSNPETLYPQSVTSGEKADISSSSEMFSPSSVQTTFSTLSSTHHPNIDLDSSVSNLSWLHNLQQQLPENNGDPNLMVNPQTGTPVTSSVSPGNQTVRVVTVPSNVHISQNSNIKYLTVPGSTTKQLYISSNRSIVSQQQVASRPAIGYQQHSYNAGTIPSSTVPDNPYPKPAYSYSCLIALSLKNSRRGSLPVAEIYNFMMTNFPYFKTAPDGWKNSVRHNLSLNKCFEKIENPNADGTHSRKGCLWTMNPAKIKKMDEEIAKWNKKDLIAIKRSMANPDLLDVLTKGQGAYLMEKAHPVRHSYQTSQYPQRPGIRIVTAVQNPQKQSVLGHIHRNQIHSFERHQYSEQTIDFNKLAQDAADMFGEHDEFSLDPSLADFTFQNGMLEELQGEMFEMNGSSNYMISSKGVSPMTSPHKSQAYNPNAILPIY